MEVLYLDHMGQFAAQGCGLGCDIQRHVYAVSRPHRVGSVGFPKQKTGINGKKL